MTHFLENRKDAFAYSTADLGGFIGKTMEISLTNAKPVFSHPHKLGKIEWDFVEKNYEKLYKQGLIRPSTQSKYAFSTLVVRKRDESRVYTDLR